jgi:hypothetical protein
MKYERKTTNKAFFLFGSPCKPCIEIWQLFLISFIFEFWQSKKFKSHFILAFLILICGAILPVGNWALLHN